MNKVNTSFRGCDICVIEVGLLHCDFLVGLVGLVFCWDLCSCKCDYYYFVGVGGRQEVGTFCDFCDFAIL